MNLLLLRLLKNLMTALEKVLKIQSILSLCLQVPEELPANLEESLSRFATKSPKGSCFSVVDNHGKSNVTLTYGE